MKVLPSCGQNPLIVQFWLGQATSWNQQIITRRTVYDTVVWSWTLPGSATFTAYKNHFCLILDWLFVLKRPIGERIEHDCSGHSPGHGRLCQRKWDYCGWFWWPRFASGRVIGQYAFCWVSAESTFVALIASLLANSNHTQHELISWLLKLSIHLFICLSFKSCKLLSNIELPLLCYIIPPLVTIHLLAELAPRVRKERNRKSQQQQHGASFSVEV